MATTNFSQFDIIHTHGDNYLLGGRHPQVCTFYGSAIDEAKSAVRLRRRAYQTVLSILEQVSARVADVNVGISEATRARIPAVSTIIPCGVDTTRFRLSSLCRDHGRAQAGHFPNRGFPQRSTSALP